MEELKGEAPKPQPFEPYCVICLSTGGWHKISQKTYENICEAEKDDMIQHSNGIGMFKNSAVMDILGLDDFAEKFPDKIQERGAYQPYPEEGVAWEDLKQLPGIGIDGVLDSVGEGKRRVKNLTALLAGLKKTNSTALISRVELKLREATNQLDQISNKSNNVPAPQ